LKWSLQGKKRRGRPNKDQDLEADITKMDYTWNQLEKMAKEKNLEICGWRPIPWQRRWV